MRRGMGASTPPCNPRKSVLIYVTCGDSLEAVQSIAGRKRDEGVEGVRVLARDGTRWPSGARPSRPLAGGQVAGCWNTPNASNQWHSQRSKPDVRLAQGSICNMANAAVTVLYALATMLGHVPLVVGVSILILFLLTKAIGL